MTTQPGQPEPPEAHDGASVDRLDDERHQWLLQSLAREGALRERAERSEAEIRTLIDTIPALAWTARADGWVDFYNRRWYEYTGTTATEMAGWGWQAVHDPVELPGVLARWRQSIETGEPFEMRFPLRAADGAFRWFLTRIQPLRDDDGQILRWFGTSADIDDQRRNEQRLAEAGQREAEGQARLIAILEQMPSGVMIAAAPSAELIYANQQARLIFRGPAADDVPATEFRARFTAWRPDGTIYDIADAPLARALRGETIRDLELHFRRPDGSHAVVRANAAPIRDARGDIVSAVTAYYDITAEKRLALEHERLYQEAGRARAEAESANRAKDEFLAMLGHELRNPLAPIVTALQVMEQHDAPGGRERQIIDRQVTYLTRLVDDLLDVSRLAAGKIELARQRVELADVVASAVELTSPMFEGRSHPPDVAVAQGGLALDGDPARLAQVVANLLSNAAKYSDPAARIQVTARRDAGDVVLCVRDHGIGIGPDLLPIVFDLFSQEHQAIDRARGGLGLGLAIVRNLVRLHGGSVAAHSEGVGLGSEFVVRLPGAAELPVTARRGEPASTRRARRTSRRVVIVDDNQDASELLADALIGLGHDVPIAHDGPSGLSRVTEVVPDVAFLDLGLPGMDGYELARRLRQQPGLERIRLIALTGYGDPAARLRSAAAGFDEHLVKPASLARIAEAIDRGAAAPDAAG
jgi:PAS domain S-box-containing protein